ncbi:conserved hypothetical protein [Pseudomonas sp. IT-196MI5]
MGASLLAKAAAHSTNELTDKTLSRAGSLPQGIFIEQGEITTLVLVSLSIVAFPTPPDWHVIGP